MRGTPLIAIALATVSVAASAAETITYTYDAHGRLVTVAHAGSVNDGVRTSYALDKADNRISKTVSGARGCLVVIPIGKSLRPIPCRSAG